MPPSLTPPDQLGNSPDLDSPFSVVQNLLPPSVKEANGATLNPVDAKDALTVVVPANAALRPDDKLKVTWTGAPGTPAEGSHTSGQWPVRDGWEVPIPNSVVAFNLGESVTVTYTVIQNGVESSSSDPFTLNVQAMPMASLPMPLILEAAQGGIGSELDLGSFSVTARVNVAPWPLIAVGQRVWLSCQGIASDGSNYTFPLYSGSEINSDQVAGGLATSIPRAELKKLHVGSELKLVLEVTFNRASNQSETVSFPVRSYGIVLIPRLIHDTSFTKGDYNGWVPDPADEIREEDGNYYLNTSLMSINPGPLVSGEHYQISVRARSVNAGTALEFWLVPSLQPVDFQVISTQWQTYIYVVDAPLQRRGLLFMASGQSSKFDIDDIRIYQA